ncbi:uncharacterized protein LOC119659029 [Hermetia illucens]|uniref:uncharacterized protein LOC119659029 n=1 Tax=Hermetia illucens TaxID=343691 RepID=UPI0018CC5FFC|nr:uncharacterized protein LOC119659029 [Hermetia illucens]
MWTLHGTSAAVLIRNGATSLTCQIYFICKQAAWFAIVPGLNPDLRRRSKTALWKSCLHPRAISVTEKITSFYVLRRIEENRSFDRLNAYARNMLRGISEINERGLMDKRR